jgi:Zn-dependent protease with chaperone function
LRPHPHLTLLAISPTEGILSPPLGDAPVPNYFPDEEFVAKKAAKFVPAMEALVGASPGRFRFRLVLHIILGYALFLSAVFAALLLSLLAVIAAFAARAIWLAGLALGSFASGIALLQSLHVVIPPPKGIPLAPEDAPLLHEVVQQLAGGAGAPQIDAILLIPEANASITSRYVNGLYGRTSTTLRLGLPLLHLLSPAEFHALLHHEFAHSSGGHGHSGIWTARVWESWSQLPLLDEEMGFSARLILPPVYRWFMPKLMAYSAVLSRVHEFAADHQALTRASDSKPDLMLIRIGVAGQFMAQRFWPEIWKDSRNLPRTPSVVFSRLPECAAGVSSSDIHEWIKVKLAQKSNPLDSHPDTSTRLKALGSTVDPQEWTRIVVEFGFVPPATAASQYFGASLSRYEQLLTEQWARGSFLIWEGAFRKFDRTRKRLAELCEREKTETLNAAQQIESSMCVWDLDGPAAAEHLLMAIHEALPDNPEAAFTLGRCLLAQDKERGVLFMERVIGRVSSSLRRQGTVEICNYLEGHNRHEEAVAFFNRIALEEDAQQKMAQERYCISPHDTFTSHGLDPAAIEHIRTQLAKLEWMVSAYLCRKQTLLSADRPLYILGLKARPKFLIPALRPGMTAFDQVTALNCYPDETCFLHLDGSQPDLEKKICKLPDSLLFKR